MQTWAKRTYVGIIIIDYGSFILICQCSWRESWNRKDSGASLTQNKNSLIHFSHFSFLALTGAQESPPSVSPSVHMLTRAH